MALEYFCWSFFDYLRLGGCEMFRVTSIFFTVLGLLICPYVCLGKTGRLCAYAKQSSGCRYASSCCASGDRASSHSGSEIPVPSKNGCDHECVVLKGTVATSQKTPREITQPISGAAIADAVLPRRLSASIVFEAERRKDVFTQRPNSGWQLRVILASFLL